MRPLPEVPRPPTPSMPPYGGGSVPRRIQTSAHPPVRRGLRPPPNSKIPAEFIKERKAEPRAYGADRTKRMPLLR
jgi:hypothetical protein